MGFNTADHQQHKQCRHCNTCCVRVHTKPPYSSSCYSGFSRQDFLQNGTECPYERPVALQCTRHRVISPITDKINEILTSRKICTTARYGKLCSSQRERERPTYQLQSQERLFFIHSFICTRPAVVPPTVAFEVVFEAFTSVCITFFSVARAVAFYEPLSPSQ